MSHKYLQLLVLKVRSICLKFKKNVPKNLDFESVQTQNEGFCTIYPRLRAVRGAAQVWEGSFATLIISFQLFFLNAKIMPDIQKSYPQK